MTHWITARRFELAAVGVALFLVWCYTRNNSFPHEYHNDEPSKTQQIIGGERNLRHPPLMLDATSLVLQLSGVEINRQNAAICGRWLSAMMVAFACATIGWLLTRIVPSMLSVGVGLLTGMQPSIFECAHFLKEDSWFLAGLVAVLLAMNFVAEKSSGMPLFLLGIAVGFAASTKYIGWTLLPLATCFVWSRPKPYGGLRPGGIVLSAAVLTALVLMLPSLMLTANWPQTITEELEWMVGGHYGVGDPVPHGVYLWVLRRELSLWILIPALAGFAGYVSAGASRAVWRLAAFYAVGLIVVLSFLPKTSDRYLLPMLLIVLPTAWLAVNRSLLQLSGSKKLWAITAVFVLFASTILPRFSARYAAFSTDSRQEMVKWIQANLPGGSLVVEDKKVNLTLHEQWEWAAACDEFFAADCGSLAEMRERGITHVAGSWDVHHRYVETHLRAGATGDFERRAEFYRSLHNHMPMIWSAPMREPKVLHPGLFLFEITPP